MSVAGWIILSYNTESYWDDSKSVTVTKQVPVWDKGEFISTGVLTINQIPLSAGARIKPVSFLLNGRSLQIPITILITLTNTKEE